jgi:hypothetical protein
MSPLANVIGVIVVGGGVLLVALKFGTIGGPGIGATREKDPFNYWLGVTITAVGVLVASVVFILTMLGVMRL